ncbi:hypothetical protein [Nakamurella endophytica]|uniref:Uncharacterized protein n=1 Tax=Nakamurella endophytica TaxID=1748367 RepID=A0A917SMI7_9ACTN|nr:hypothetical protein [Nakamurella endophytica]GGL89948.1 hypothetical protein GCM10011594_07020 [Nakamurella endophytica]
MQVSGIAEAAVEGRGLVLRETGTGRLLSLVVTGGLTVPVGVPLRVRGELQAGIRSYRQQGTPLVVQAVDPIER